MKKLIILVMAFLLFAGQAWAGGHVWKIRQCDPRPIQITVIDSNGNKTLNYSTGCTGFSKDQAIEAWAASGEICRVLGHTWRDGCRMGPGCLVNHGGPVRHCPLCGKQETCSMGD